MYLFIWPYTRKVDVTMDNEHYRVLSLGSRLKVGNFHLPTFASASSAVGKAPAAMYRRLLFSKVIPNGDEIFLWLIKRLS